MTSSFYWFFLFAVSLSLSYSLSLWNIKRTDIRADDRDNGQGESTKQQGKTLNLIVC